MKPDASSELIISIAKGTASTEDIEFIKDEHVITLLRSFGRRLRYIQLDDSDVARFIDTNKRGISVKEYPVLVHCDSNDQIHLYYLSDLFTDDFVTADLIENELAIHH